MDDCAKGVESRVHSIELEKDALPEELTVKLTVREEEAIPALPTERMVEQEGERGEH